MFEVKKASDFIRQRPRAPHPCLFLLVCLCWFDAVYTGWELHGCGYKVVRCACVSMVSEKSARSKAAWERQTAAARELSGLPHGMEAALRYLRTKGDTLPSDVAKYLGNQCFCCGKVGHRAEDCPEVSKEGKERTPKQRAPTSRAKRKKG